MALDVLRNQFQVYVSSLNLTSGHDILVGQQRLRKPRSTRLLPYTMSEAHFCGECEVGFFTCTSRRQAPND